MPPTITDTISSVNDDNKPYLKHNRCVINNIPLTCVCIINTYLPHNTVGITASTCKLFNAASKLKQSYNGDLDNPIKVSLPASLLQDNNNSKVLSRIYKKFSTSVKKYPFSKDLHIAFDYDNKPDRDPYDYDSEYEDNPILTVQSIKKNEHSFINIVDKYKHVMDYNNSVTQRNLLFDRLMVFLRENTYVWFGPIVLYNNITHLSIGIPLYSDYLGEITCKFFSHQLTHFALIVSGLGHCECDFNCSLLMDYVSKMNKLEWLDIPINLFTPDTIKYLGNKNNSIVNDNDIDNVNNSLTTLGLTWSSMRFTPKNNLTDSNTNNNNDNSEIDDLFNWNKLSNITTLFMYYFESRQKDIFTKCLLPLKDTLTELILHNCLTVDSILSCITQFRKLKVLSLISCYNLSNKSLAYVNQLINLESLTITSYTHMNDFRLIKDLVNLTSLKLKGVDFNSNVITDGYWDNFNKLKYLHIACINPTYIAIDRLINKICGSTLETLIISHNQNPKLSNLRKIQHFSALSKAKNLKHLECYGNWINQPPTRNALKQKCWINEHSINELIDAGWPNKLTSVVIDGSHSWTDKTLIRLSDNNIPLHSLQISVSKTSNGCTIDGFKQLLHNNNLTSLTISNDRYLPSGSQHTRHEYYNNIVKRDLKLPGIHIKVVMAAKKK